MDLWHDNRVNVHNDILISVTESWTEDVIPSTPTPSQTTISAPLIQEKKKKYKRRLKLF